ncbi:polysaccharide deacetylase family protein [Candidatus Woesearchaeota archaeon]|jgi:alpha-amylase|nr:polysaccharide deacetylase family protein [Candidatus Woesearchaeota archaeon]MBT4368122.1 polysaccharide deacetylase family protein [Candidatus Woesearchaeota archaeon]MBT4712610.1 polysaccharide deacetylase family protein [Candidatus Woesearchaeota archaeon]MBT6639523.1 polysaccharide deacetylase family protein [Candidatus Woesearchaeota archaeon]MBT7133695.1 polysaccharide deacetylase family protein [Candidatus Woesearchaeota archaeon]
MVDICFYFQVHQPFRMKKYSIFQIGNDEKYFDSTKNQEIMQKVTKKCYLPTNKLMLELLRKHPEFKIAYSISGTAIDQFEKYSPEVLDTFKELAKTKQVEFLDETYHHSLSFLYSKKEFYDQVEMHTQKMQKLFGVKPKVFRNTELIYNNELAEYVEKMGYKGILAEGADHVLGWKSPNFLYQPRNTKKIKLLLKNYKLSDDIAFRFSDKSWPEHPLTTKKFGGWLNKVNGNGICVNLFMDYETFGEHQWSDTGIFKFMKGLPAELLKHPDNQFKTPLEVVNSHEAVDELHVPHTVSWADTERDVSAWLGNKMQQAAISRLYAIEEEVKQSEDKKLLETWRRLTTSDHFYYMCTKWFSDGDVHKYFNPYETPYDSFINFMNILNDMLIRLKTSNSQTGIEKAKVY